MGDIFLRCKGKLDYCRCSQKKITESKKDAEKREENLHYLFFYNYDFQLLELILDFKSGKLSNEKRRKSLFR